jgi:hypothetical protein
MVTKGTVFLSGSEIPQSEIDAMGMSGVRGGQAGAAVRAPLSNP